MYLNLKYYQDDWANTAIDVRLTHRFNLLYPNHSPPWTVTSTHSKCNRTENSKVHSPQIDPWFQDRSSIRAEEHLIGAQTITQAQQLVTLNIGQASGILVSKLEIRVQSIQYNIIDCGSATTCVKCHNFFYGHHPSTSGQAETLTYTY